MVYLQITFFLLLIELILIKHIILNMLNLEQSIFILQYNEEIICYLIIHFEIGNTLKFE